MIVGIIGLGLIGGSTAKAYKNDGHTVYAYDIDESVTEFAIVAKTVDKKLTDENISDCNLIVVATYPEAAIKFMKNKASLFSKNSLVIDFCGTKRKVCEVGFSLAKVYGFTFIGGHPMAGTHNSGFLYSKENMFKGASMVIVPPTFDDIKLLERVKDALTPLKFGKFTVTTAEEANAMVEKLRAYYSSGSFGSWKNKATIMTIEKT